MSVGIPDVIQRLLDSSRGYSRPVNPSRKSKRASKKTIRRWTWQVDDGLNPKLLKEVNMSDKNIFLGTSDVDDLLIAETLQRRVQGGKSTHHRETTVLANRKTWQAYIEKTFSDKKITQGNASGGMILFENDCFMTFSVNSNTVTVRALGDEVWAESVLDLIEQSLTVVTSYIEWVYNNDGSSVNVPLNRDRLPLAEMYPFLNGESLESYYDRYMESSANILLLIGPPGTGKTTFIRGLLSHRDASAIVTYDAGILEKDGFFARFIEDDTQVMVLEDSDAFLKSRSDGNTMMHRFLNVGDGLVTTKGKKMIFSTNLPSIRDIDSALVRPGRCFDILTFRELTRDEADLLANKLGVTIEEGKDKYSLAEIFNKQTHTPEKAISGRKVGFL
jgi:hypothetical protein